MTNQLASVTVPVPTTDARLTSTTVPEAAPAAWSGATTYALNDIRSVFTGYRADVYQSLQAANLNHAPASSPTWWKLIGTTYKTFSMADTYAAGDIVIDPVTHLEYTSAVGSNTGHALPVAPATSNAWWVTNGSTNARRMFNLLKAKPTTSPVPISVVITPGQRVDTIVLDGLVATQVVIEVKRAGVTVYGPFTVSLSTRVGYFWRNFFFNPFRYRTRFARFDLPQFHDAVIYVTVSRSNGSVSVGKLILGKKVELGIAAMGPVDDAFNNSKISRDPIDGDLDELIPRRSIPTLEGTIYCDESQYAAARQARIDTNAVVAFWALISDPDHAKFEGTSLVGIYRQFSIAVDYDEKQPIRLRCEET